MGFPFTASGVGDSAKLISNQLVGQIICGEKSCKAKQRLMGLINGGGKSKGFFVGSNGLAVLVGL